MRHSITLLRFHNALLCTMLTATNNSTGSQKHLIFPLFSVLCLWIKFTFLFGCVPSVLKKKKKKRSWGDGRSPNLAGGRREGRATSVIPANMYNNYDDNLSSCRHCCDAYCLFHVKASLQCIRRCENVFTKVLK